MIDELLDLGLLALIFGYCVVAPYTKVEESFNLQAVHDLVTYGPLDLSKFDHWMFPGVVKRTFVGASVLSAVLKPYMLFLGHNSQLIIYQYMLRFALGLLNWFCLARLTKAVRKISHNNSLGLYYALLQYSQFHIVYYSSRTLPNFILLPLVSYSLLLILENRYSAAFTWLSFTAVVFRAEIGVFAVSVAFVALLLRQIRFFTAPIALIKGVLLGSLLTVCVDSYFWGKFPSFPEIESILFNVYSGNSKLWGTEPFDAYFTKYSLNIFCPPTLLLFAIPGVWFKSTKGSKNPIVTIGLGSLLFVFLLSFQPHKEWRFIVYAIPGLTLLGANGAAGFRRPTIATVVNYMIIVSSIVSLLLSLLMMYISSLNYPGGVAITTLNNKFLELDNISDSKTNVTVHIGVPACMSGVTLFTRVEDLTNLVVNYDKTEDKELLGGESLWKSFDYVISDQDLDKVDPNELNTELVSGSSFKWEKIETIKGFTRIDIMPIIRILRNYNIGIKIAKDVMKHDFTLLEDLKNSVIVQDDKLFIYSRQEIKK